MNTQLGDTEKVQYSLTGLDAYSNVVGGMASSLAFGLGAPVSQDLTPAAAVPLAPSGAPIRPGV